MSRKPAAYRPPPSHTFPADTTVAEACFYHGIIRAGQLEMEIAHAVVVAALSPSKVGFTLRKCASDADCGGTRAGATRFQSDTPLRTVATHAAHASMGEGIVVSASPARKISGAAGPRASEIVAGCVSDARVRGRIVHGHHNASIVPRRQNLGPDKTIEFRARSSFQDWLGTGPSQIRSLAHARRVVPDFVATTTERALHQVFQWCISCVQRGRASGDVELEIVSEAHLDGLRGFRPSGDHAAVVLDAIDADAITRTIGTRD